MARKLLIATAMCLIALPGFGNPVQLGNTTIDVPDVPGFAIVTPDIQPLYDVTKEFVYPGNTRFSTHVPESAIAVAIRGELPEFRRYMAVESANAFTQSPTSSAEFRQLRTILQEQRDQIFDAVLKQMPNLFDDASKGIKESLDVEMALSLNQVVPLPTHLDEERRYGFSMYTKQTVSTEYTEPEEIAMAATSVFMHIKGRIIFLYVYGGENDLEWTRQTANDWSTAIVAANPSSASDKIAESTPRAVRGIDWGRVLGKAASGAVVGGIIGGAFGLFGWLTSRFRKKRPQPGSDDLTFD